MPQLLSLCALGPVLHNLRSPRFRQQRPCKAPSLRKGTQWISLAVQWLRLHASNAGGMGSAPSWGTKILPAMQHGQKKIHLIQKEAV